MRLLAVGRPPDSMPRNGAELVAYWEREGLIGTRPDVAEPSGGDPIHLTEARRSELDRRIAELDDNPQNVLTWEEVKDHLRGR